MSCEFYRNRLFKMYLCNFLLIVVSKETITDLGVLTDKCNNIGLLCNSPNQICFFIFFFVVVVLVIYVNAYVNKNIIVNQYEFRKETLQILMLYNSTNFTITSFVNSWLFCFY